MLLNFRHEDANSNGIVDVVQPLTSYSANQIAEHKEAPPSSFDATGAREVSKQTPPSSGLLTNGKKESDLIDTMAAQPTLSSVS